MPLYYDHEESMFMLALEDETDPEYEYECYEFVFENRKMELLRNVNENFVKDYVAYKNDSAASESHFEEARASYETYTMFSDRSRYNRESELVQTNPTSIAMSVEDARLSFEFIGTAYLLILVMCMMAVIEARDMNRNM